MRFILSSILAGLATVGLAAAQAGTEWNITNVPSSGLNDLTFPFSFAKAPHETGYYFANQIWIVDSPGVIYGGFQPRPDNSSGKAVIHSVFSSFLNGTTSSDDNCGDGADDGPGVSCAYEFEVSSYDGTWNLVVTREDSTSTVWSGAAVHAETGDSHHIGTFTLPSGTGGLFSDQYGFVEYYPWNGYPEWTCKDNVPYTEVTFYPPTTESATGGKQTGALYGFIKDSCKGYGEATTASDGSVTFKIKE
ncbi:hypothetical protein L202_04508 [Cryptococcus amylolentus CBS 6039]|uniref:Uncharacterized protein n=2 Tax=Cryptococcus amylolentus TaxID=104669 RepID=A0A1E3HRN8_9TREE|nr:hypothetical protein L202_04508 [Cryptococcus amylolentus CBS 6039]ODN78997.1 hypothetical protein L202_04508 [Cryptococcus amylolentus CBS 6039]ODO06559.1 hypothetical protein I350_03914 [Cryptococcus amylolentus CBS 6273]